MPSQASAQRARCIWHVPNDLPGGFHSPREAREGEETCGPYPETGARKGRNVAKQCVFPMICGPGGSKSRLAKAAGAEPAGQMRDEQLHTVVARSTFRSQNVQNTHARTTFGSWDVGKVHAVVARSTFRSQHVERTRFGPLLDFEMSKKCTRLWREADFEVKRRKHTMFGPLLEVEMSKKCTPLWREAHFEVKLFKTPRVRTIFGRSDVVSRGRRKGLCTLSKVSKTWGFCRIFNYKHNCTTLDSNTLHYNYDYTFTTLHSTPLHYTTLHSTTLNYTQLHYATLQYNYNYNYIRLHYTTLITLHYAALH